MWKQNHRDLKIKMSQNDDCCQAEKVKCKQVECPVQNFPGIDDCCKAEKIKCKKLECPVKSLPEDEADNCCKASKAKRVKERSEKTVSKSENRGAAKQKDNDDKSERRNTDIIWKPAELGLSQGVTVGQYEKMKVDDDLPNLRPWKLLAGLPSESLMGSESEWTITQLNKDKTLQSGIDQTRSEMARQTGEATGLQTSNDTQPHKEIDMKPDKEKKTGNNTVDSPGKKKGLPSVRDIASQSDIQRIKHVKSVPSQTGDDTEQPDKVTSLEWDLSKQPSQGRLRQSSKSVSLPIGRERSSLLRKAQKVSCRRRKCPIDSSPEYCRAQQVKCPVIERRSVKCPVSEQPARMTNEKENDNEPRKVKKVKSIEPLSEDQSSQPAAINTELQPKKAFDELTRVSKVNFPVDPLPGSKYFEMEQLPSASSDEQTDKDTNMNRKTEIDLCKAKKLKCSRVKCPVGTNEEPSNKLVGEPGVTCSTTEACCKAKKFKCTKIKCPVGQFSGNKYLRTEEQPTSKLAEQLDKEIDFPPVIDIDSNLPLVRETDQQPVIESKCQQHEICCKAKKFRCTKIKCPVGTKYQLDYEPIQQGEATDLSLNVKKDLSPEEDSEIGSSPGVTCSTTESCCQAKKIKCSKIKCPVGQFPGSKYFGTEETPFAELLGKLDKEKDFPSVINADLKLGPGLPPKIDIPPLIDDQTCCKAKKFKCSKIKCPVGLGEGGKSTDVQGSAQGVTCSTTESCCKAKKFKCSKIKCPVGQFPGSKYIGTEETPFPGLLGQLDKEKDFPSVINADLKLGPGLPPKIDLPPLLDDQTCCKAKKYKCSKIKCPVGLGEVGKSTDLQGSTQGVTCSTTETCCKAKKFKCSKIKCPVGQFPGNKYFGLEKSSSEPSKQLDNKTDVPSSTETDLEPDSTFDDQPVKNTLPLPLSVETKEEPGKDTDICQQQETCCRAKKFICTKIKCPVGAKGQALHEPIQQENEGLQPGVVTCKQEEICCKARKIKCTRIKYSGETKVEVEKPVEQVGEDTGLKLHEGTDVCQQHDTCCTAKKIKCTKIKCSEKVDLNYEQIESEDKNLRPGEQTDQQQKKDNEICCKGRKIKCTPVKRPLASKEQSEYEPVKQTANDTGSCYTDTICCKGKKIKCTSVKRPLASKEQSEYEPVMQTENDTGLCYTDKTCCKGKKIKCTSVKCPLGPKERSGSKPVEQGDKDTGLCYTDTICCKGKKIKCTSVKCPLAPKEQSVFEPVEQADKDTGLCYTDTICCKGKKIKCTSVKCPIGTEEQPFGQPDGDTVPQRGQDINEICKAQKVICPKIKCTVRPKCKRCGTEYRPRMTREERAVTCPGKRRCQFCGTVEPAVKDISLKPDGHIVGQPGGDAITQAEKEKIVKKLEGDVITQPEQDADLQPGKDKDLKPGRDKELKSRKTKDLKGKTKDLKGKSKDLKGKGKEVKDTGSQHVKVAGPPQPAEELLEIVVVPRIHCPKPCPCTFDPSKLNVDPKELKVLKNEQIQRLKDIEKAKKEKKKSKKRMKSKKARDRKHKQKIKKQKMKIKKAQRKKIQKEKREKLKQRKKEREEKMRMQKKKMEEKFNASLNTAKLQALGAKDILVFFEEFYSSIFKCIAGFHTCVIIYILLCCFGYAPCWGSFKDRRTTYAPPTATIPDIMADFDLI